MNNEIIEDFKINDHLQHQLAATIDLLAELCATFARDRGFIDEEEQLIKQLSDNPKVSTEQLCWFQDAILQAELARVGSEVGEAIEAVRKPHLDEHVSEFDNLTVELADTIIRIGDIAGRRNLSLGPALVAKLNYNLTRPYKHGKKS